MGDDSAGMADERAESGREEEEEEDGGGDQDWEDADSSDAETVRHASVGVREATLLCVWPLGLARRQRYHVVYASLCCTTPYIPCHISVK